ncbi:MAG: hypothetical protein ISR65_09075 [Bacteriovoracaceae bacterium]|nr:hypothetical protein [Bacteriovoracaceae bacterium]
MKIAWFLLIFSLVISLIPTSNVEASRSSCFSEVSFMMAPRWNKLDFNAPEFHTAKTYLELEDRYGSESLLNIQNRLSKEEILKNNENVSRILKTDPEFEVEYPGTVKSITEDQGKLLQQDMMNTPVVDQSHCYGKSELGFCFGRALVAHSFAIKRGVHPHAIKKIWVVGDTPYWEFHVATIFRTNGGWYVVDKFTGVVKTDVWMERMRKNQRSKEAMFFVTDPSRFTPLSSTRYNEVDLFNGKVDHDDLFDQKGDFYKGFFHNFFVWFDKLGKLTKFSI